MSVKTAGWRTPLARLQNVTPDRGSRVLEAPGPNVLGDQLIALTGAIRCEGEIIVEVEKMLEVQSGSGHNAFVLTTQYRYHAMLPDGRNILRYENSDHHQFDHVHRYDPSAVDRKGTFQRIQARDDVPTLGDVLRELRSWYEEHADRLMA